MAGAAAPGEECRDIEQDDQRLACYDRAAGRTAPAAVREAPPPPLPERPPARAGSVAGDFVGGERPARSGSGLGFKWELDDDSRFGVLRLRTHKPNYFLFARWSDNPNQAPFQALLAPPGGVDEWSNTETKFQISLKSKLVQGLFNDRLDLWVAYTQQSHWQIYAPSAPFRETNYEPEAIATWRTDVSMAGWRLRMVNFGLVHQSNGQGGSLSRSWNRLYAQFGVERGGFSLLARPWWRIPEREGVDNNPDITDYMGRGDLLAYWQPEGSEHSFALLARGNLQTGKGAAQLDWRFPLYRNLKGYLQLFSGYGESLIDYNWRQNTIGLGVSLSDWQ